VKSTDFLLDLVRKQHQGEASGIYSVCTYNRFVLEAVFMQAARDNSPVLIEATCNQVNHEGGYTGMTPPDFMRYLHSIAEAMNFPSGRLIVGGDHLGPYPFRSRPAAQAMENARSMVRSYVEAGYDKIHLDTSMRLAGDPGGEDAPLDSEIIAERCADLAAVAEEAVSAREDSGRGRAPLYVIGTEVPAPGGSDEVEQGLQVTDVADFEHTVSMNRELFIKRGLQDAWDRVFAVVVQPGVEHGDHTIIDYDRDKAKRLTSALGNHPDLVFEGHATDYQKRSGLRHMVEDGIAVLKVGPSLTFAVREAVFALSWIEEELLRGDPAFTLSEFVPTLERAMLRNPEHWQKHYPGGEREAAFARKYSFFDRARYYWVDPEVEGSLQLLLNNLGSVDIPLSILSQYFPRQLERIRRGAVEKKPVALIRDRVMNVLENYSFASGFEDGRA
jgi:D-tagatose-1,6-bisphosphate aldolase subunit GatZ/KbaZ